MSNCLNCDTPIETNTGRRPKKYCSDICRATHYQKNKPKEKKFVQSATHEAVLKENKELKTQLEALKSTVSENKAQQAPETENHTNTSQKEKSVAVGAENASDKAINNLVGIVTGIVSEDAATKIAQYENEMKHLGEGSLGKLRKKQLEKLIAGLKK